MAQRYPCPVCADALDIRRMYDKKYHVRCAGCGRADVIDPCGNLDGVVLEFACRCDDGRIEAPGGGAAAGAAGGAGAGGGGMSAERLSEERLVRSAAEIDGMVGGNDVDEMTARILRTQDAYVSHYERIERAGPGPGPPVASAGLGDGLAAGLAASGITELYGFQADAIARVLAGENVVIEAPTASGKTEAFAVPVLEALRRGAEGAAAGGAAPAAPAGPAALFVYPTKALARDQLPKVSALARSAGLRAAVFDGDTPEAERARILRRPPHALATNFDTLHHHMMRRTRLSALLSHVRHLVVDEAHVYSGVFGSAVHYVVRRLDRIAGRRVQVVAASATLDDAAEFCGRLFGRPFSGVRGAGAASQTEFVMLFPTMAPRSSIVAALARDMTVVHRKKAMIFSGSHAGAEVAAIKSRRRGVKVGVHRAGLSERHRRSVEESFRRGELRAVSCTPTLELGIDIGDVDAVVSSPAPYNRLVQRMGRAARQRGRRGCAVLALGNDPISQYYSNHPRDYFEDSEGLYMDPTNPVVVSHQALAMACDRAVRPEEAGDEVRGALDEHARLGNVVVRGGRYAAVPEKALEALSSYNIRGIGESLDIVLGGRRVGERAFPMALDELHPDAVYLMAGSRYRVRSNDHPSGRRAVIEPMRGGPSYYTKAIAVVWPRVVEVLAERTAFGAEVAMCRLRLRRIVSGYVVVDLADEAGAPAAAGEAVQLAEPLEYSYETRGIVLRAPRPADRIGEAAASPDEHSAPPPGAADAPGPAEYAAASSFHAAEHVLIEAGSMVTGAASRDLGGISLGDTGLIFVHDGAVGGTGASRALYDRLEAAAGRAAAIVRECPCRGRDGCPRCTYSYMCGNNNAMLDKAGALEALDRLASGEETALGEAVRSGAEPSDAVPVV